MLSALELFGLILEPCPLKDDLLLSHICQPSVPEVFFTITSEGLNPRYDYRKVRQVRYKASDVHTNDPYALEEADPSDSHSADHGQAGLELVTGLNAGNWLSLCFLTFALSLGLSLCFCV